MSVADETGEHLIGIVDDRIEINTFGGSTCCGLNAGLARQRPARSPAL